MTHKFDLTSLRSVRENYAQPVEKHAQWCALEMTRGAANGAEYALLCNDADSIHIRRNDCMEHLGADFATLVLKLFLII